MKKDKYTFEIQMSILVKVIQLKTGLIEKDKTDYQIVYF